MTIAVESFALSWAASAHYYEYLKNSIYSRRMQPAEIGIIITVRGTPRTAAPRALCPYFSISLSLSLSLSFSENLKTDH